MATLVDKASLAKDILSALIKKDRSQPNEDSNSQRMQYLAAAEQRLNATHFSIVVVGEAASGKSEFINRLVGQDLLPTGMALPTTCIPVVVRFGMPAVSVKDDRGFKREAFLKAEHPQEVKAWLNEQFRTRPLPSCAFVTWMLPFLGGVLRIIDTPGVNAGRDSSRETLMKIARTEADLLIVTISADRPLSESTVRLCNEFAQYRLPMLYVMTRADQVADEVEFHDVRNSIEQRIDEKLGHIRPLFRSLSGQDALIAVSGRNLASAMEEQYGIEVVRRRITELHRADSESAKASKALAFLKNAIVDTGHKATLWEVEHYLLSGKSSDLGLHCRPCGNWLTIDRSTGVGVCPACKNIMRIAHGPCETCPTCKAWLRAGSPFCVFCGWRREEFEVSGKPLFHTKTTEPRKPSPRVSQSLPPILEKAALGALTTATPASVNQPENAKPKLGSSVAANSNSQPLIEGDRTSGRRLVAEVKGSNRQPWQYRRPPQFKVITPDGVQLEIRSVGQPAGRPPTLTVYVEGIQVYAGPVTKSFASELRIPTGQYLLSVSMSLSGFPTTCLHFPIDLTRPGRYSVEVPFEASRLALDTTCRLMHWTDGTENEKPN